MNNDFTKCNNCKERIGSCTDCGDNPLKNERGNNMEDIDKAISEAFGKPENVLLDEKIYSERMNADFNNRKEDLSLTEAQRRDFDKATLVEVRGRDRSLDTKFCGAFGSNQGGLTGGRKVDEIHS